MRRDLPGPTAFFCPPRRLSINAAVGAGAPDGPATGSPCYAQGRTLCLPVGRGESAPPLGVYGISCSLSLASQFLTPIPKGIRLSHEKGRRLLPASSHTSARLTSVAFLGLLALLLVLVFALILILILILVLVLILILVLIVLSHTEHLLFLTVYALSVP